jgi:hypothetical protein
LLPRFDKGGRVKLKLVTDIWTGVAHHWLVGWTDGAVLKVSESNTKYIEIFKNMDIMAVLCPSYLIKWEGWIPNQLPISGDVHPPVPQLCGHLGHFYKSQEVI